MAELTDCFNPEGQVEIAVFARAPPSKFMKRVANFLGFPILPSRRTMLDIQSEVQYNGKPVNYAIERHSYRDVRKRGLSVKCPRRESREAERVLREELAARGLTEFESVCSDDLSPDLRSLYCFEDRGL